MGIDRKDICEQLMYEILKLRMKNHMNTFKGLQTGINITFVYAPIILQTFSAGMFDVQL